jgi:CubicO group peptidase (beta-lactamase class C family)
MRSLSAGVLVLATVVALAPRPVAQSLPYGLFERYLESLREQTGIPGLSATIVQGRRVVWEAGLGKQDVDRSIAASPSTPYPIGDLTQTFAAVLIGLCVDSTGLNINQPIRRWSSAIPEASATVSNVMSHASSGNPGDVFSYDPSRYAALTAVVDSCGWDSYRKAVADEVFHRLGMNESVPGLDLANPSPSVRDEFDESELSAYASVLQRMAVPYRVDRSGRATRGDVPGGFSAATGLVSTVRDLSRFDIALDDGILVRRDLLAVAWTNVVTSTGAPLPTGLGWFVQNYNGERLVWHLGYLPGAASSLILKVPGRDMTLILLANSDGLGQSSSLSEGDITSSLFAKLFLRLFVG